MLTFEGFGLNHSTPAYRQLKTWIAEAIRAGKANPGMPLPSERDLADRLEISRVTVRKALDELVAEGLVTRRRGSGTYVAEPPRRVAQSLSRLYSFSEDMRARAAVSRGPAGFAARLQRQAPRKPAISASRSASRWRGCTGCDLPTASRSHSNGR